MLTGLNIVSALLAIFAACAWIQSARAQVVYSGKPGFRPPGPSLPNPALLYGIDSKGRQIDLIPTLKEQSKWNRYAALLAAAAAFFQAAVALAPALGH